MAGNNEKIRMLGQVPLFEGLSRKELEAVLRSSDEVNHREGADIVSEGGGAAGFHLILEGQATVTQHGEVRRRLGPGEFFGEIALIDGQPRSATVHADTPVRTLSVTSWNFRPLLSEHPELAHKLLIELCRRLREAEAVAAS